MYKNPKCIIYIKINKNRIECISNLFKTRKYYVQEYLNIITKALYNV